MYILISASCTDLRQMIKICELEMLWLDMYFNAKKSCLVRCGPRYSKILLMFSWMVHHYVYVTP